jgi:hypothetical protein
MATKYHYTARREPLTGGNRHEKVGHTRILRTWQVTIPNTARTSPHSACKYTATRSSQPNQPSRNPEISNLLVFSTSFSSSTPICLFPVHNSIIITERIVKSSLCISPCHDHVLTLSTTYTKYSIHRVQHTPSTASTQHCLSSLHSHDDELTPECSFIFRHASLHNQPPSASSPWQLKGTVTLLHSHGCKLTDWWTESQHPACCPYTALKYVPKLARFQPTSSHDRCLQANFQSRRFLHPSSLDQGLQVHLQTRTIMASKLACWRPPSASPNSLDYGLQVHMIMASKWESPNSHNEGLEWHLQTPTIRVSKFAWPWHPSVSKYSLNHGFRVSLWDHLIVIFRCTSNCSWAPPAPSPDISCVDGQLYRYTDSLIHR